MPIVTEPPTGGGASPAQGFTSAHAQRELLNWRTLLLLVQGSSCALLGVFLLPVGWPTTPPAAGVAPSPPYYETQHVSRVHHPSLTPGGAHNLSFKARELRASRGDSRTQGHHSRWGASSVGPSVVTSAARSVANMLYALPEGVALGSQDDFIVGHGRLSRRLPTLSPRFGPNMPE